MQVLLAILGSVLLIRGLFVLGVTVRYRSRGALAPPLIHVTMMLAAAAIIVLGALEPRMAPYAIGATAVLLGSDLIVRRTIWDA